MHQTFFTPGPSALYYTVDQHAKTALRSGIASISHRGTEFKAIYKQVDTNLRALLQLPDNYSVLFTNSATEVWDLATESLIQEKSLHIVNGAFSEKFYKIVNNSEKEALLTSSEWGDFPEIDYNLVKQADHIAITHNETSTGVSTPLEIVYKIREENPEAIISVDAVSSLPYLDIDYSKIDALYVSVQKCFGLPAGLGIWLVNDRCMARAEEVQKNKKELISYHNLLGLAKQAANYQTVSTPNVLNIYLLAQITSDMLNRGIQIIRSEIKYKSAIFYKMIETHPKLKLFVKDKILRSDTIIVLNTEEYTQAIINFLANKKLIAGTGYGKMNDSQVRIANFPTHSKEQFEMLTDLLETW
ncbi:MAG: aminotransferase class V-fold PLP-dependent enzyme [Cyclobacteriaceae bacterium]|nr:aminotransferase class V-fold PLP-dependent enzyme [Cyclobacteriaceae bacterium]